MFASLLTKTEVIAALVRVRGEVVKMTDKHIFMLHHAKPSRMTEFQQTQWQAIDSIRNYLRDVWLSQMQRGLVTNLERVGKGWFNIHETNHQTYMYSKLRRLLNMVRFEGVQGNTQPRFTAVSVLHPCISPLYCGLAHSQGPLGASVAQNSTLRVEARRRAKREQNESNTRAKRLKRNSYLSGT